MDKDIQHVLNMVQEIDTDCHADADRMADVPFNGHGVGGALGEHLAMIAALAKCVKILAVKNQELRDEIQEWSL